MSTHGERGQGAATLAAGSSGGGGVVVASEMPRSFFEYLGQHRYESVDLQLNP
jgi:hypothetical protein